MFKFIDFEGPDTCGKTTQIELLKNKLGAFYTKEPGSPHDPVCMSIRQLLLHSESPIHPVTEALLYAADRVQHYHLLKEKLKTQHVVCDRSIFSSLAYQSNHPELDMLIIQDINAFIPEDVFPQIVFYLRLDSETIQERFSHKELDRIEQFGNDFFAQVVEKYDILFRGFYANIPDLKIYEIDATQSIETIHLQILNALKEEGVL